MSRPISLRALTLVYAQETGDVLIAMLTFTHPNLAQPIRICNAAQPGGVPFRSRSQNFLYLNFDVGFPIDRVDQPPQAALSVDAVDRSMIVAIRSIPITQPANVLLELAVNTSPDTVEIGLHFTLRNVDYDAQSLNAVLAYEQYLAEPYPGDNFDPASVPGIFQ